MSYDELLLGVAWLRCYIVQPIRMISVESSCTRVTHRNGVAWISVNAAQQHIVTSGDVAQVCELFSNVIRDIRAETPGISIRLDRFDFSQNGFGNDGLIVLVHAIGRQDAGVPRVLLLWQNLISDGAVLMELFITGSLHELHLSMNMLSEQAVLSLVCSALTAKRFNGEYAYPYLHKQQKVPLWLRLENQKNYYNSDRRVFFRKLHNMLCMVGFNYEDDICFVEGKSQCRAGRCSCAVVPSVHLTYLKGHQFSCNKSHIATKYDATQDIKCPTVRRGRIDNGPSTGSRCIHTNFVFREFPKWLQIEPPPGLDGYEHSCGGVNGSCAANVASVSSPTTK